jgi:5'-nucleotidase
MEPSESGWRIGGADVNAASRYRIAVSDFLLTGREQNLDFLTRDNSEITVIREHADVRQALIAEIRRQWR